MACKRLSNHASCCTATRPAAAVQRLDIQPVQVTTQHIEPDVVKVPGGTALVGTNAPFLPMDGEGPLRKRRAKALYWERGTVTNAAFARFVEETAYVTEAERFGWSFVFHLHLDVPVNTTVGIDGQEWWRRVDGASWRYPNGPGSAPALPDHPVVQVSWNDATAYAKWAGGRLPSEAEWEHAARGGLGDVRYPWGDDDPHDDGNFFCNIWQGRFPIHNTAADGYEATAPAISFLPNDYGLYNMVGNVWQWTADPFKLRSVKKTARQANTNMAGRKLLKGGSYLCHRSYCFRYRIAARTGNTPDSASTHTGFRIVYDVRPGMP